MRIELNLDELERLAKAATPGPWEMRATEWSRYAVQKSQPDWGAVADTSISHESDMAFISAANPAVVLELVRRLREAEEIEGVLIDALEQCRGRFAYYVQHHLDKGNLDKAAQNERFVALADAAIASAEAPKNGD